MATLLTRLSILLFLALLCGCNGLVRGLYPPGEQDAHDIFIANNHWHTGFALRLAELSPSLQQRLTRFAAASYIEIGWGDDHFYRSPESTSGLATEAMFFSQGTVLHIMQLNDEPAVHYRGFLVDLYRVRISGEGLRRLVRFIESSFDTDKTGAAIELQPGVEPNSWFYKARGTYSLFRTCNQWTADGLRQTGFPITPIYATTAGNVGWQISTFIPKNLGNPLILHDGQSVGKPGQ